jgi:hypothetical protein
MSKIPAYYFMPGLAASASIFERIQLPEADFEVHLWEIPLAKESLDDYAKRIAKIKREPGVNRSFVWRYSGSEMAKHINTRKVIIISSVKKAI